MIITKAHVEPKDETGRVFSVLVEGLDEGNMICSYEGEMQAFQLKRRKATSTELELADDMEQLWVKHRSTRRQRFMEILDRRDGLIP